MVEKFVGSFNNFYFSRMLGLFFGIFPGFFEKISFYLEQKISAIPSWPTYQPTMSDFCPIMSNLPTYLKSDVINGRSLSRNQTLPLHLTPKFWGCSGTPSTPAIYGTES